MSLLSHIKTVCLDAGGKGIPVTPHAAEYITMRLRLSPGPLQAVARRYWAMKTRQHAVEWSSRGPVGRLP